MKNIIVHHNDLDGRCAGAVVLNYLSSKGQNIYVIYERDYTQVPLTVKEAKGSVIYFVDYSFSMSTIHYLIEYLKVATSVTWIDHHKISLETVSRENLKERFNNLVTVLDVNRCGAFLTYKFFYKVSDSDVPNYIKLVDIYDRWVKNSDYFETACKCKFKTGIEMQESEPIANVWKLLIVNAEILEGANKVINKRRFEDFGYFAKFFGNKVPVINSDGNSKLFGDLIYDYPYVVRWHYKNGLYTYSIYSVEEYVDCSYMARVYGGGGHKGAASFQSKKQILPYKDNVYSRIRNKKEIRKYKKMEKDGEIIKGYLYKNN